MPYVAPSAAELKQRFPIFSAVDDAVVTASISEGARRVDETWSEADFALAIMLYAAHTMVMDGHGSSTEVQLAGFKRVKVGSLELERSAVEASSGVLASTSFGRRFEDLQRLNFSGPVVV